MGGILMLAGMACAVGALMPSGGDDPSATENSPDTSLADSQSAADQTGYGRSDYLSGELVLQQQADGHFYASPAINHVPIDALIDTGASVIALTGEDAGAIGLNWNDADVRMIGHGASGEVYGVPVRLERVELGSFEVYDVDAVIIPEGLHVTLLGQSFLSRIPNVKIADGRMNLSDY